jgi:hypothetical protein
LRQNFYRLEHVKIQRKHKPNQYPPKRRIAHFQSKIMKNQTNEKTIYSKSLKQADDFERKQLVRLISEILFLFIATKYYEICLLWAFLLPDRT